MPFLASSLENIAQCRNLKDLAPVDQQETLMQGLEVLHRGRLKGHKIERKGDGSISLELYFHDENVFPEVVVKLDEAGPQGPVVSTCENIPPSVGDELSKYQWGAAVLLWWAYAQDASLLRRMEPEVSYFCRDFQELIFQHKETKAATETDVLPADLTLDSLSLCLDELPLRGSSGLAEVLPLWDGNYELQEVPYVEDPRNSSLWDLPQVFRKPLNIDTVFYWSDLRKQNQLAAVVRYNFSNGVQLSSREILRHSYRNLVPRELLPASIRKTAVTPGWPFLHRHESTFISRDLSDIEEVLQELLVRVGKSLSQGKVKFYLQSEASLNKAIQVKSIAFDAGEEFHWDVQFEGETSVLTKVSLQPFDAGKKYFFFQSFALDIESGKVVAFPWLREVEILKEFFGKILQQKSIDCLLPFSFEGHQETSAFLKLIRSRPIPVQVCGGTHHLPARSSVLEMHFKNDGGFHLEHVFPQEEKPSLHYRGWSTPAVLIIKTLSLGLSTLMSADVKSLVSRSGSKREWDMKMIRHLGVLQYLALETLSLYFDEHLTDGTVCSQQHVVTALHSNIQAFLVAGEGTVLDRSQPLSELCSRPVIASLESFVAQIFKSLSETYSVFTPDGEMIYAGLVERDFRVLYEILKQLALSTQGACFKKGRTSFLSRIWDGDPATDVMLAEGDFFFPTSGKNPMLASQALVLLQPLKGHGIRLLLNGQPLVELADNEFQVDFQIVSNIEDKMLNWFELNPRFFLQGQEVDPDSLKNLGGGGVLEYNGQFFIVPQTQIPSMRRLESFWLKLQQGKVESSKKKWTDKYYQIPKSQTLELLALRASGYAVRGDAEWKKLCDFYDSLNGPKNLIKIPSTVKGDLKQYQHEGFQWLYDLYNLKMGALLADDMGLGKTLQTLSFLEHLRTQEELGQVLVIVPSSLVYNWESEIAKFTPNLPLQIFTSKDVDRVGAKLEAKEPLVVLTTYGLLMENDKFLSQYKWNVLIFDEAQNLKNITTKRTSSARMLTARFKICMTGTPMENHYGEFYSLMDLIVPGCLGKYDEFRRHFVNTDVVLVEDVEDLKLRTKPLLLRRTKKEILDQLPDKQETRVSIAFEEQQKKIYRDIALAYNEKIQETMKDSSESQVQLQMLTALLRLRQACSDPGALPQVKYDQVPPKLEALLDSLKEIIESGESALVFTQFIQTLEHTEKMLKEAGIPVFVLHGSIPTKQRQKVLREFNESNGGAVLVMTLKTGGVGLNLTKASYVFHLEPWWNPSVENQATDRAHRLGQKKAVQVFRYIMHESLEEKMEQLKARKNKKFQSLFSETESVKEIGTGSGALSKEDFDFLLGLK